MKVLDRLKMELSNQQYFSDEQYIQFLTENSLTQTDEYDKSTMQKSLLFTVVDVLVTGHRPVEPCGIQPVADLLQQLRLALRWQGVALTDILQRLVVRLDPLETDVVDVRRRRRHVQNYVHPAGIEEKQDGQQHQCGGNQPEKVFALVVHRRLLSLVQCHCTTSPAGSPSVSTVHRARIIQNILHKTVVKSGPVW